MMTPAMRGARTRFRPYERALFARQIVVTIVPVVCFLLRPDASVVMPILFLAVAATILNSLYYLLHIKGLFPESLRWGRLVLDIVLWTMLLEKTGGPASLFFLGYLVEVLISAIALSGTGCLVAAFLASSGYLVLLVRQPDALSWEHGLSRILTLLLAGIFCKVLIRKVEARWRQEGTDLRRRLARAEELGRLGEAAAGMLHEVRNTVHGLGGFISILKDDLATDPRGAEVVSLIESGVKGMHDRAEEVLAGSRGSPQERSPVDVREVIRESIAFATRGRSAEGIEIVIEETAPRHTTLANREALRGVFVNLINNALEASPAGGTIFIKIGEETPGTIRLDFTDSGSGIPPAIRERIFEPLVTTRAGGSGLGLGVSRRTVERCDGSLVLSSTGTTGTTMTVRLPTHQAPLQNQPQAAGLLSQRPRSAQGR